MADSGPHLHATLLLPGQQQTQLGSVSVVLPDADFEASARMELPDVSKQCTSSLSFSVSKLTSSLCLTSVLNVLSFFSQIFSNSKFFSFNPNDLWGWIIFFIVGATFCITVQSCIGGLLLFCLVAVSWLTQLDCSPLGSSVHGISQARILEWVALPSSRESS